MDTNESYSGDHITIYTHITIHNPESWCYTPETRSVTAQV